VQYLRQASAIEQEVFRQTEKGIELLKMVRSNGTDVFKYVLRFIAYASVCLQLRLDEACEAFNRVFDLRPNAYLWQAGIAKFYQGDLHGAADVFARCALIFESKFGGPASEERIWRDACELKLLNSLSRKEKKEVEEAGEVSSIVTAIPDRGSAAELQKAESRKVIRIARDLFSSSIERDYPTLILSRAKLRSIGGNFIDRTAADRKMWKLNSWYYLGLHYDAISEFDEAKECMKMALSLCPSSGNASDIIHTLPILHMSKRDWFDDLDMSLNPLTKLGSSTDAMLPWAEVPAFVTDPLIVDSIRGSVAKMRTIELRNALQARDLKCEGSKEHLQRKLFYSLVNDDGLREW
jgi:tetratricopeptide (TPR) repeat protein